MDSEWIVCSYLFAEVCAILYENSYYNGWAYKLSETDSENILDNYNTDTSSIKVRNGCTFKGYRYANKGELMFTSVDDMEYLEEFDREVSSYSCECSLSKLSGQWQIKITWQLVSNIFKQ